MEKWILEHLDGWLYREFHEAGRAKVREAMLAELERDTEFWSRQGWPALCVHVNGYRLSTEH